MRPNDPEIEVMLTRYRPTGPPAGLRDRVLRSTGSRRSRWAMAAGLVIAAMLVLSVGLDLAARRMMQETAAALGAGRIEWTPEAEEIARMLNGDGEGRRYIALALAAGVPHREGFPPQMPGVDASRMIP